MRKLHITQTKNEDDDFDYDQEGSDAECNYIQLARSNYTSAI